MAVRLWRKNRFVMPSDMDKRVAIGWTRDDGRFQIIVTLNGVRLPGWRTFDYVVNVIYDALELVTSVNLEIIPFSGYPEIWENMFPSLDAAEDHIQKSEAAQYYREEWAEQKLTFGYLERRYPDVVDAETLARESLFNVLGTINGQGLFTDIEYEQTVTLMLMTLKLATKGTIIAMPFEMAPGIISE